MDEAKQGTREVAWISSQNRVELPEYIIVEEVQDSPLLKDFWYLEEEDLSICTTESWN